MDEEKLTCLVTIHGIGEQHAPANGSDGYADGLHRHLLLDPTLGDNMLISDPLVGPLTARDQGRPIYVVGTWPPKPGGANEGLRRLGVWTSGERRSVDSSGAPLSAGGSTIAHIAIVYADEQAQGTHIVSDMETAVRAAISFLRYATVPTILKAPFVALDEGVKAVLEHFRRAPGATPSSQPQPAGVDSVFRYLDDDVALYVCRNDLRERVRSFVHDALLRLCCRDDVASVVVNSHSNGTVIASDILRELPPVASDRIEWFVTAGSPLRKYVDLFRWGTDYFCAETGTPDHPSYIPQIERWTNFWDAADIVADPLAPPEAWRRGDPLPDPAVTDRLFRIVVPGTGKMAPLEVQDIQVDNVRYSPPGGYPPHNYWDNEVQVVSELATIVQKVHDGASGARMFREPS